MDIDDPAYREQGTSKAKRLRTTPASPAADTVKRWRIKTVLQENMSRGAKVGWHARRPVLEFGRGAHALGACRPTPRKCVPDLAPQPIWRLCARQTATRGGVDGLNRLRSGLAVAGQFLKIARRRSSRLHQASCRHQKRTISSLGACVQQRPRVQN